MSDEIPIGLPFSQAYLRPAIPLPDGKRFRIRLSAHFDFVCPDRSDRNHAAQWLKLRAGIEMLGGSYPSWESFFKKNPIVEVLDAIGLIFEFLDDPHSAAAPRWKDGVEEILLQQAMAYRLDEECAVRRLVDDEFERSRVAAIAGLGSAKLRVAKGYFDQATAGLENDPPDTAGMVRNVFMANEEVFKLMFPAADRLVAGNVRNHLQPERGVVTQSAITASQEMANSFAKWVGACQQYRHAPGEAHDGEENPAVPPLDLAIAMMSAGAAFLRWLIAIDAAGAKQSAE